MTSKRCGAFDVRVGDENDDIRRRHDIGADREKLNRARAIDKVPFVAEIIGAGEIRLGRRPKLFCFGRSVEGWRLPARSCDHGGKQRRLAGALRADNDGAACRARGLLHGISPVAQSAPAPQAAPVASTSRPVKRGEVPKTRRSKQEKVAASPRMGPILPFERSHHRAHRADRRRNRRRRAVLPSMCSASVFASASASYKSGTRVHAFIVSPTVAPFRTRFAAPRRRLEPRAVVPNQKLFAVLANRDLPLLEVDHGTTDFERPAAADGQGERERRDVSGGRREV